MTFKELDKRSVSEVEKSVLESWSGIHSITNKQVENTMNSNDFIFYDGLATANSMPVIRYIKSIYLNFLLNQGITG